MPHPHHVEKLLSALFQKDVEEGNEKNGQLRFQGRCIRLWNWMHGTFGFLLFVISLAAIVGPFVVKSEHLNRAIALAGHGIDVPYAGEGLYAFASLVILSIGVRLLRTAR